MSVQSEIDRINGNVAGAYAAVAEKGGTVPDTANSENLQAAVRTIPETGGDSLPKGTIVIWSGSEDNIPSGWHLCDGTNGTPDLRSKYVLGAGPKHAVGISVDNMTLSTGGLAGYYVLCYIMKMTEGGTGSGSSSTPNDVYSTEETRIGTWIDGKPLYRIVMHISKNQTANGTKIALPVLNVDTVYYIGGIAVEDNIDGEGMTRSFPFPGYYAGDTLTCTVSALEGITMNRIGSTYVGFRAIIVLEYTKTTDEPETT